MRTRVRLYKMLLDERRAWQQRIHGVLFHDGVTINADLLTAAQRSQLEAGDGLSSAAQETVIVALRRIDGLTEEMAPLRRTFADFARRQPGCRGTTEEYRIGSITGVAIWAEMGDCRRFSSSRDAVRHTRLDVTVHSSDGKRTRGHLSRQGPPVLRWALFEAAQCGARRTSPELAYYASVKERQGGNRAALSVARKLVRRAHHRLPALGDEAFAGVR